MYDTKQRGPRTSACRVRQEEEENDDDDDGGDDGYLCRRRGLAGAASQVATSSEPTDHCRWVADCRDTCQCYRVSGLGVAMSTNGHLLRSNCSRSNTQAYQRSRVLLLLLLSDRLFCFNRPFF